MSWMELPDELAHWVTSDVAACDALVTLSQLDRRSRQQSARRLSSLSALREPPFELSAATILGHQPLSVLSPDTCIGQDGARVLAGACGAGALRHLASLHLSRMDIGASGMEALALACCSLLNLKALGMYDNTIGDAGVQALVGAAHSGGLTRLEHLHLGHNQIGDAGAEALALSAGAFAALTVLSLEINHIGDRGMRALADACRTLALPSIWYIYLGCNPGLGTPVRDALQERRRRESYQCEVAVS
jgi:hypothetical protein